MTKKKIDLATVLRGCTPGKIQTVGNMQVIPLISEISNDKFVSPSMAKSADVSTSNYGSLAFKNNTDKDMIVPSHAAYVVKEAAQDHAIPHVGLVRKKTRKTFNTAACIQQTQGGYISNAEHDMIILPFQIREDAHKTRKEKMYNKLWNSIIRLNRSAGVRSSSQGHLEYFLDHYEKQLDQFVAEFEPVNKQVGAIILVNGHVVGIEKAPNYQYWLSIWGPLIRTCYGSLAIMESDDKSIPETRSYVRKADSLNDLKNAITEADKNEYEKVKQIVNAINSIDLGSETDETWQNLEVKSLSGQRFVGQIVSEEEEVVFVSLVATSNWRKHGDWYEANDFKM
ncbi:MAG: ARPP-1 family domain-containing protein [Elusimicrobiota bacterium]